MVLKEFQRSWNKETVFKVSVSKGVLFETPSALGEEDPGEEGFIGMKRRQSSLRSVPNGVPLSYQKKVRCKSLQYGPVRTVLLMMIRGFPVIT